MPLFFVIGGIIVFLLLILLLIKYGIAKEKPVNETDNQTVIHTSGIYSIVRKSPRENIIQYKPSNEEIIQYLNEQTVDIQNNTLSEEYKKTLVSQWNASLDNSIAEIEVGDKKGLEFYYYNFAEEDSVCSSSIKKGYYITREDIYSHPELIPPFHLGCKCILKNNPDVETLTDTAKIGMQPFVRNGKIPSLPDWKLIWKI